MRRSPARAKGLKAGAEGFEPSGVLPPLVFKTSAFVRSAMPPHTLLWRRLYDLRAEHLSSGAQASPGCAQWSCVVIGWKGHEARDEREVARARQRAHPSCGGFACSGRIDRSAEEGGRQGGRTRGFRRLRSQPRRVVLGERPLPSSAYLSAHDREAEEVGSHDDLRPYSGYLHPYLPTRAGGWLADGIAWSDLDVGIVRRRAQTSVDGRPTLALRGNLPGYGVARRDRRLRNLPGDTIRRDSLDPRRRPRLQRRRPDLRSKTSQPGARNLRIPRAVAPLCHGGKRLPFLGDAALHRADLVSTRDESCYRSAEAQISFLSYKIVLHVAVLVADSETIAQDAAHVEDVALSRSDL